jgi:hypothetical protein
MRQAKRFVGKIQAIGNASAALWQQCSCFPPFGLLQRTIMLDSSATSPQDVADMS